MSSRSRRRRRSALLFLALRLRDVGRYIDGAIISSLKSGLPSLGAKDGRFFLVEVDLVVHAGSQVANPTKDAPAVSYYYLASGESTPY